MDLSGAWLAHPASEALRRGFPADELDESDWDPIWVPGHWRTFPAFADCDGPLLYRRRFSTDAPGDGRRRWLRIEGLFYQGDVWLDGAYVGDTEGYFVPHAFEVTEALSAHDDHLLAIEVACSATSDPRAKRNLTGVFQHWDCIDPQWNPGGIWRPVTIEETGPVRIARMRCTCPEATPERAIVRFRASLDAAGAGPVTVRTMVGETSHEAVHSLAAGENRVEWTVVVDRPALWWPHMLGPQPLQQVQVEVVCEGPEGPAVSDRRELVTGLRQVRMHDWVLRVNGEPIFLKGSNYGPTRMAIGDAESHEMFNDVRLAKEAGLDFLRVHAHVARRELYAAADQSGLLIWQDMPLQWGYSHSVRKQAVRQSRELVDLLGHHPSVAIWCGHNEPIAMDPPRHRSTVRLTARVLAGQALPTWNKTFLDRSIRRALSRADPTRPVVSHSGIVPHPGSGGTDSHLWFGWYHGRDRDLSSALAAWPRLASFVTEFGAQAVPTNDEFCHSEAWPDLDWEHLERRHSLQKPVMDRFVPAAAFESFAAWRDATQAYQANVVKHHVETLRRLKYNPTGGFAQFHFADSYAAITWSVLDHQRIPKAGYHALAAACAPVIVVADRPAPSYVPGQSIVLDVHVVSDLRIAIEGAIVKARLRWPGGEETWTWIGDVPADSCVRVGTLQAIAPEAWGPISVELNLHHAEAKATNRYDSRLTT